MNQGADFHRYEASRRKLYSTIGVVMLGLFLLAGVGVFIMGIGGGRPSHTDKVVIVMCLFVGATIAGIIAASSLDAARKHAVAASLAEQGLEVDARPTKQNRDALFAPFVHLKALTHGAKGLRLWAAGEVEGRQVQLIEHSYTVHAGNSHRVVRHTVVAVPCPPTWPALNLAGQNLITGWWASLHGRDLELENEEFNKRWIVKAENEDFALVFLSPQVQEFLTEGLSGEAWQIGNGWIYWLRQKGLKAEDADMPIDRLMGLMERIPPELSHWQG